MNNLGEQINSVLNNLSNKLGMTVDKLHPILKRQSMVDSIKSLIIIIPILILMYNSYKIIKDWYEKNAKNEYFDVVSDDNNFIIKAICIVATVVFSVTVLPVCVGNLLDYLLNPDYFILKQLFKMIVK